MIFPLEIINEIINHCDLKTSLNFEVTCKTIHDNWYFKNNKLIEKFHNEYAKIFNDYHNPFGSDYSSCSCGDCGDCEYQYEICMTSEERNPDGYIIEKCGLSLDDLWDLMGKRVAIYKGPGPLINPVYYNSGIIIPPEYIPIPLPQIPPYIEDV